MGVVKRIGKSETLRGVVCRLIAWYVRLVYLTGRWQFVGDEVPTALLERGQPFILAFWHGRLLMMINVWQRPQRINMLISQHRDGQLIARTIGYLGIGTVAGSSTRGGAQALRGMLKLLKGGECIGFTPDGPRGPRMRATSGVVIVAKLSGCPIIPAACAAKGRIALNTWDRFQLPPLFGKGVFVLGEPIHVPKDADDDALEAARAHVERTITELSDRADALVGAPPITP